MLGYDWSNIFSMASMGETVRRLREQRRMSQEELASAAGLSRATIQNIEADRKKGNQGRTVRSLAKAFGLTLDQLEDECAAGEDLDAIEVPDRTAKKIRTAAHDMGMSIPEWFEYMVTLLQTSPELVQKLDAMIKGARKGETNDPSGTTTVSTSEPVPPPMPYVIYGVDGKETPGVAGPGQQPGSGGSKVGSKPRGRKRKDGGRRTAGSTP